MTSSNSFSAWKTVDDMVSKPIIGSDGAASWQEFQKSSKEEGNSRKRHFISSSNAPQMPTKRGDKLATGFQTLAEERANEEKIRKASGEASGKYLPFFFNCHALHYVKVLRNINIYAH